MSVRINADGESLTRTANLPASSLAFTCCCWMYVISIRSAVWQGSIGFDDGTSNQFQFVGIDTNIGLTVFDGGGWTVFPNGLPATSAWHFIAMRQNATQLKGYHWTLDGTLETQTRAHSTSYTLSRFKIGNNVWSVGDWTDGRFAAVKLWDAILTDDEVAAERLTILPKRYDNLIEFWPCFPGSGQRAAGYSKGRNFTENGTLSDEEPPPVPWGASAIFISAGAADPNYTQVKFRFYNDDGVGLGGSPP
jgi:hypothetical protein